MNSLILVSLVVALAQSQQYYILQSAFSGGPTFLDNFEFWTSWDPTFGYVHYVDEATAQQFYMINTTDSTVAFGAEATQILDPNANLGRLSLRLTSIQTWTHGLFILDLAHMPSASCGTWPSFWSLGGTGTWPMSGEVDIIELVNDASNNLMSLHTLPGCSIAGAEETGTLLSSDCGLGGGFAGCTVEGAVADNSGSDFNANGGGVYVMEWTSVAIRIWFFPRNAIPESITSGTPDVAAFGLPTANFQGSCDIDQYFYNHSLIFNIDFCGSWAGPTFITDGCPALDPSNSWSSCNEFVALNPEAFAESYWEVNYLDVYQLVSGAPHQPSTSLSSVTPAIVTSSVSTALSNAQGRSTTPTMSIAGTTPFISTGPFTATSSVLSVLSSLSTSSVVASSISASLVGRSPSSSPGSVSAVAPSVPVSPTSPTTGSLLPTFPVSAPVNPPIPPSSDLAGSITCSDGLCTEFTTALIVQTVTVAPIIFDGFGSDIAALARRRLGKNASADSSDQTTTAHHRNPYGRCDFTISTANSSTDFLCTFTSYLPVQTELWTASYTRSTALASGEALVLSNTLEVDSLVVSTDYLFSPTLSGISEFTGSFTPTAAVNPSTKLTAYAIVSSFAPPMTPPLQPPR